MIGYMAIAKLRRLTHQARAHLTTAYTHLKAYESRRAREQG